MDSNPVSGSAGSLPSRELKRRARAILTGRYALPMSAFALSQLMIMCINLPFELSLQNNPSVTQLIISGLASVIILLLSNVLAGGLIYIHLNIADEGDLRPTDIFRFFNRNPERFVLSKLLFTGITLLPMLPAIGITAVSVQTDTAAVTAAAVLAWIITLIPVLYLSYTYALTNYLLAERPEDSITDVYRNSRRLMKGYKGKLFYLSLSFLGMYLLSVLSLGIGFLWVIPYRNQTFAEFYRNIRNEL